MSWYRVGFMTENLPYSRRGDWRIGDPLTRQGLPCPLQPRESWPACLVQLGMLMKISVNLTVLNHKVRLNRTPTSCTNRLRSSYKPIRDGNIFPILLLTGAGINRALTGLPGCGPV